MTRLLSFDPPRLLAVGLFLALVGLSVPAGSTTMPYATVPDLVQKSDLIVRGTVDGQRSFVDSETNRITTHTTIDLDRTYFGETPDDRITLEQWGGQVDGRTLRIPGNASFQDGEEVLLFLEYNDGADDFPVYLVAMAQAKFHITDGDDGRLVSRSAEGIEFLQTDKASERLEQPTSFESFEVRMRSIIYSLKGGTNQ